MRISLKNFLRAENLRATDIALLHLRSPTTSAIEYLGAVLSSDNPFNLKPESSIKDYPMVFHFPQILEIH